MVHRDDQAYFELYPENHEEEKEHLITDIQNSEKSDYVNFIKSRHFVSLKSTKQIGDAVIFLNNEFEDLSVEIDEEKDFLEIYRET